MSKCWYCNNELTSGDSPKHFGICNKCYDEMFKSSDTIISSFTNKISDLEAKLAESESKRKSLEEKVKFLTEETEENFVDGQKYNELREQKDKEIKGLKQQLAEKDKDIKHFKESYYMIQDEKDHYAGQCLNLQDRIEELEKIINESFHNQDKISFAVEQLEKVKEKILSYEEIYYQFLENGAKIPVFCVENFRVRQNIDNQIKELKGEK